MELGELTGKIWDPANQTERGSLDVQKWLDKQRVLNLLEDRVSDATTEKWPKSKNKVTGKRPKRRHRPRKKKSNNHEKK